MVTNKYPWAPITPYGASKLPTDSTWFLEADMTKFGGPEMRELARHVQIQSVLDDPSRDWRMVEVYSRGESEIPRELMLLVGKLQAMPDGVTLTDVKADLYGGEMLEPMGAFEWFATNYPEGMQTAIDSAEVVKESAEEVGKFAAFGFGSVLGVVGALWFASRLLSGGKR